MMNSDRGKPVTLPRYTRVTTPDGKTWVCMGDFTEDEVLTEIERIEERKHAVVDNA